MRPNRIAMLAIPLLPLVAISPPASAQIGQGQEEIKITRTAATIAQPQDEVWEVTPYTHATLQLKVTELSLTGGASIHFYLQTSNTLSDQDWAPMDTLTVPAAATMPQFDIVELSLDSPNPLGRYLRWEAEFTHSSSSQYAVFWVDLVGRR